MIAVIPARGGSKGLPGKNIRPLRGKPLIAYTIEAARNADCVDRVIVTTDDEDIANIARQAGADIPFRRPSDLASDTASAVDVYLHAVEFLMTESGKKISKFMVLLPTAPLRTGKHIDEAFELFQSTRADTLLSVREADVPPSWYLSMDAERRIRNANFDTNGTVMANRQINSTYYIPNGAIYILDYDILKKKRTYYTDRTIGYVMSKLSSADIDTIDDFKFAEYLMSDNPLFPDV